MLRLTLAVARKDLALTLARGSGLIQALLLGLLLLFVFSLSQGIGERMSPQAAAAVFWLSSAFCQVLIFNQLYALEEANNARLGLLLCPAPIQGVWLGKAAAGLTLLLLAQVIFLPASVIFLGQELGGRRCRAWRRCCWWIWACVPWVPCWGLWPRGRRRANPC